MTEYTDILAAFQRGDGPQYSEGVMGDDITGEPVRAQLLLAATADLQSIVGGA